MSKLKKEVDLEKYNLFPIEIYKTNIGLDYTSLINDLYTLKKINSTRIGYNKGGWQSTRKLQLTTKYKNLANIIENLFKEKCIIHNMWGSISSTGDCNNIHNHPPITPSYTNNNFWSGIFYLKTFPNSGHLNIHSPVNVSDYQSISPIPGDLILFNSTTYHSVDPNLEREDRICIAFNLELL